MALHGPHGYEPSTEPTNYESKHFDTLFKSKAYIGWVWITIILRIGTSEHLNRGLG